MALSELKNHSDQQGRNLLRRPESVAGLRESYGDAILGIERLFDLAEQGSSGAHEALRHISEVAIESALKWAMARRG